MMMELRCCGEKAPIGVDKHNIRLSFTSCGSPERYEIKVWEEATGRQVWQKEADLVSWVDPACLEEKTAYRWQVTDKKDGTSEEARFETGPEQWQGRWIAGHGEEGRVLEFRRHFTLEQRPRKARLYVCGLGYFSPQLNGRDLEEAYFIPPVTEYTARASLLEEGSHAATGHRVTYYTYDITELLSAGENSLNVQVAGGYYSNQEKTDFEPQPDLSFGEPCLIFEIHMEDKNGDLRKLLSDTKTLVRCTNTLSQLFSGDRIDFTEEPGPFLPARLAKAPQGRMTSPQCPPDRLKETLTAVNTWEIPEGTVYDFGVNHSGGLRFTAEAEEETELVISYAEVLNEDGTLNMETAAWHGEHNDTGEKKHIYQQSVYRLKAGINEIAPRFSWFCYRYVLIPRCSKVRICSLHSLFIHTDIERDGSFECADPLLSRIDGVFQQTLLCNMHSGLVMDCPHREKVPYTGDGKLVMKSAFYGNDVGAYYYKWFRDILDAQTPEGLIPNSAPYYGGGGGYAWGNSLCTVAKQLYAWTGDPVVAEQGYAAIRKWLDYYESKRDENFTIRGNSHNWMLGDWLAPEPVISNVYYISTVCYLQAAKTALFFADILDPSACGKWRQLIGNINEGIQKVFFDEKALTFGNGVQGENMLALAEDIVPAAYKAPMEAALRHHYTVQTHYHLDTGIVLTPVLMDYLTENGFRDIAWELMTARTYPSYFNLMDGDTTFSEHWSKKWPDYYCGEPKKSRLVKGGGDLSHCHPMYGATVAWLYEKVAGLDLNTLYRREIHVTPYFMDRLAWAKAEKKTPFGQALVRWTGEDGRCRLEISVPAGLKAKCSFPACCGELINKQTGERYRPDETGFFRFALDGGSWELEAEK